MLPWDPTWAPPSSLPDFTNRGGWGWTWASWESQTSWQLKEEALRSGDKWLSVLLASPVLGWLLSSVQGP